MLLLLNPKQNLKSNLNQLKYIFLWDSTPFIIDKSSCSFNTMNYWEKGMPTTWLITIYTPNLYALNYKYSFDRKIEN